MKKTETKQILELLTQLTEAVIGPAAGRPPTEPKPSISERVDKLDDRVSEVQLGLATLAADTKAQFQKVDARFDLIDVQFKTVNRNIAVTRVELVDHMERIHSELTGRIIDLEVPGPGGRGGSASGSGGVPLAS
jgi:hypothetical protein